MVIRERERILIPDIPACPITKSDTYFNRIDVSVDDMVSKLVGDIKMLPDKKRRKCWNNLINSQTARNRAILDYFHDDEIYQTFTAKGLQRLDDIVIAIAKKGREDEPYKGKRYNQRKRFDDSDKNRLYQKQHGICTFKGITMELDPGLDGVEIDHMIPFTYVGDYLSDNIQLLPKKFNQLKGIQCVNTWLAFL